MPTDITPAKRIFQLPIQIYDLAIGECVPLTRYLHDPPFDYNTLHAQVLAARKLGKHLTYSYEWSGIQRCLAERDTEQEARFVDKSVWTETFFDFNDETIKEGVEPNSGGTFDFAGARTVLGSKEGIYLPQESKNVHNLPDKCKKAIAYIHGVSNVSELPPWAYIAIDPNASPDHRIPIVRYRWFWGDRKYGRVNALVGYAPAGQKFAAWLVDETKPENVITLEKYVERERRVKAREAELRARFEAELRPLRDELDATVVLIEL